MRWVSPGKRFDKIDALAYLLSITAVLRYGWIFAKRARSFVTPRAF